MIEWLGHLEILTHRARKWRRTLEHHSHPPPQAQRIELATSSPQNSTAPAVGTSNDCSTAAAWTCLNPMGRLGVIPTEVVDR